MLDPTTLFTWAPHVDQRAVRADTLIVTMGSYADVGHTQRQLDEQFLQFLPNRLLGTFDSDQVIDYLANRPAITFDKNHFVDYRPPQIALHQVTDSDGRDFLLLNGPEPSLQWERLAASVKHLIDQLDVQETVLVQTIPSPAPHTRPVVISRYASDPALVEDQPVLGTFALRAPFTALLMTRLGETGDVARGLLAHVPHYLADTAFPAAASAMISALQDTTHLRLPTTGLDAAGALVRQAIDAQVEGNEEFGTLLRSLEEQFDQYADSTGILSPTEQQLPDADEIGARFEDFLANLKRPDDPDDAAAE